MTTTKSMKNFLIWKETCLLNPPLLPTKWKKLIDVWLLVLIICFLIVNIIVILIAYLFGLNQIFHDFFRA